MNVFQVAFATAFVLTVLMSESFAQQGEISGDQLERASDTDILGQLLEEVRTGTTSRRQQLQEREERFQAAADEQGRLLEEATADRISEEQESDRLRELFEAGEDELAELETRLSEQSGDLTDVFAVVKQVASDVQPLIQNSLVSAELPNRLDLVDQLAAGESIPSAEQLRGLWHLLLEEMSESGQVSRFEVPLISAAGDEVTAQVTRVGSFSAVADGEYLRFLPESGRLLALARQPASVSRADTRNFENATSPLSEVAIDPSRGAILSLIVQTPSFDERIRQGGFIGYVILLIGAIGLIIGLQRFASVMLASRRTQRVVAEEISDAKHPVSQLRQLLASEAAQRDVDALTAKVDEILTTAAQSLRKGLATLSIFAAVSPLLGLLGTVTGMIETFQVITLFGAGDPRLMSGGISQALITTQLGLAVAIPLLLIHSFVQGKANSVVSELDEFAADAFAQSRGAEA